MTRISAPPQAKRRIAAVGLAVGLAGGSACQPTVAPLDDPQTPDPAPVAAPRLERDPGAGVSLVYQAEAVEALAIPGRVVVLEPDFMHLHGVEPGSGELVWRRRIQRAPDGAHTMHADDFRVLVHAGTKLIVVDARDGRILGRSDEAPPFERRRVELADGACAYVSDCAVAPFDCTTAARIDADVRTAAMADTDDGTATCTSGPALLGRDGDLVIVRRPDPAAPTRAELVALDPEGTSAWTVQLAMTPGLAGGVAAGSDATWIWDADAVAVVRSSTGQIRWRAELELEADSALRHEGMVVVSGHDGRRPTVAAWDLATGQPRWRRRLRPRRIPLLDAGEVGPLRAPRSRIYELLAVQTGASLGRMAATRDETIWRDVDGGYLRTNGDFEELSARGEILRQRPYTGGEVLAIGTTHVVSRSGRELHFHDRIALRERARLLGGFELDPTSGRLGPHRVLLRRSHPGGTTFVIVGLEPRTGRRGSGSDSE